MPFVDFFAKHTVPACLLTPVRNLTQVVSKDQDDIGLRVRGDRDGLEAKDADEDDVFHDDPIFL